MISYFRLNYKLYNGSLKNYLLNIKIKVADYLNLNDREYYLSE